jgi:hypothetical protein
MLSRAKHLAFSGCYEDEILRLRLRMTLRHSLDAREDEEGGLNGLNCWNVLNRCINSNSARGLRSIWLVHQRLLDRGVYLRGHGVANLFGDVAHDTQCAADQGEGFDDLPRIPHVQRDGGDDVHRDQSFSPLSKAVLCKTL